VTTLGPAQCDNVARGQRPQRLIDEEVRHECADAA